ncbi:LLM class F420-dependent oxidoreductase [Streptomyces malaysiense]|uniref:LLM class F420-dependent oxidoreductase n=1 Tax=Streptomyces malaysiense TaxID=1428626 RepID=A0A1J4QAY3_9ACTN|nr:LLM class F420-dependent oxidoreductase [Streptomyces malaysiense]OIK29215.1 LLM class F420-dependent oxidoreductase [Streptomyces malaysiense]
MRVGLHALGIGNGARPEVIRAVAQAAETHGLSRLWAGEHVVLVDAPLSRYPYSDDGRIAVPADADWLDPLLALSFAAAVTKEIGLATGVLLLPEHNPVVVAKQTATLDVLSAGRLTLGIGIGWSEDEFDALGVPFTARGRRTEEYLAAMRTLWRDDVATFEGEFTRFHGVRVNPRPVRGRGIPVVMGGNGTRALRRAATIADGWYGFNLSVAEAMERVPLLAEHGPGPNGSVRRPIVAVALTDATPAELPELARAGVTEVVIAGAPPSTPDEAGKWVADIAERWVRPAAAQRP